MNNLQRLGGILSSRMVKTAGAAIPMSFELGTINANHSLSTDSLGSPIPKGQYMVDIRLSADNYDTSEESHQHQGGDHSHSDGMHSHELPKEFRSLRAYDRVLVAWCGNEPVVIAIVVGS